MYASTLLLIGCLCNHHCTQQPRKPCFGGSRSNFSRSATYWWWEGALERVWEESLGDWAVDVLQLTKADLKSRDTTRRLRWIHGTQRQRWTLGDCTSLWSTLPYKVNSYACPQSHRNSYQYGSHIINEKVQLSLELKKNTSIIGPSDPHQRESDSASPGCFKRIGLAGKQPWCPAFLLWPLVYAFSLTAHIWTGSFLRACEANAGKIHRVLKCQ